jgi:hypothetical protein
MEKTTLMTEKQRLGAASLLARVLEREQEIDLYRGAVVDALGDRLGDASDERFLAHVARCFDYGVSAAACGRTWAADSDPGTNSPESASHMGNSVL